MLLSPACNKISFDPSDCPLLANATILPEDRVIPWCDEYYEVYRYKGELYTLYQCCSCNTIPMAIDCNGKGLCHVNQNCMEDFFTNAKYLYAVKEN